MKSKPKFKASDKIISIEKARCHWIGTITSVTEKQYSITWFDIRGTSQAYSTPISYPHRLLDVYYKKYTMINYNKLWEEANEI